MSSNNENNENNENNQNNESNKNDSMFTKKGKGPAFRRRNKPKDNDVDENIQNQNTQTAAHLRIQRDFASLEDIPNMKIIRKEDEWMEFSLIIKPIMGYWEGGLYEFKFNMPVKYPFDGPKVICVDKIYHPNIDLEGKICVNILRPWKPTYTIETIMIALLFLFTTPNPNDPLNNEAAADMRKDPVQFGVNVKNSMKGYSVGGVYFPRNKGLDSK